MKKREENVTTLGKDGKKGQKRDKRNVQYWGEAKWGWESVNYLDRDKKKGALNRLSCRQWGRGRSGFTGIGEGKGDKGGGGAIWVYSQGGVVEEVKNADTNGIGAKHERLSVGRIGVQGGKDRFALSQKEKKKREAIHGKGYEARGVIMGVGANPSGMHRNNLPMGKSRR